MSEVLLSRYIEERKTLEDHVSNTLGRVEAEQRDMVDAERESLEKTEQRLTEVDREIESIKKAMEARQSSVDVQHLLAKQSAPAAVVERAQFQINEPAPSLGDFVNSEAYRNWNGHGPSGHFSIEERATIATRAPLQEGAAPGSALLPYTPKYVLPQGQYETPLLSAVGHLQVSTNSVDMVTYGGPKGATGAAVVPELSAKPEAAITATSTVYNVETIAYWIQASRQLLQDAPAARGLIDNQLRLGLRTKLESEVATAIKGATYAKTTGASKAPLIEVARQAMANIQVAGFQPNAIIVNPMDAASFDLTLYSKTLLGAAFGSNVWGLEIIPSPDVAAGKAYLGDFKTGVTLLERTGIEMFISDSHIDTFVKNIFTILAEIRAKAIVSQPAAITELALTP